MARMVILTNGNYFAGIILSVILKERTSEIVQVIEIAGDYRGRAGLNAAWHLARSMAFRFFLFKLLLHVVMKVCESGVCVIDRVRLAERQTEPIPLTRVPSVAAAAVRQLLEELRPDLLVSVSCPQKISGALLSLAKYGGINIHSSLLPAYAGLAPYFWVLANGERMTGTSLHWMTEKWDQGNILVQKEFPIPAGLSVFQLFRALARLGSEALVEGVELALAGAEGRQQDRSHRSYYSHPTAKACKELKRRGHCLMRRSDCLELFWDIRSRRMEGELGRARGTHAPGHDDRQRR